MRRKHSAQAGGIFLRAVLRVAVTVGVIVALFTFAFGLVRVEGDGMKPTSGDGDVALTVRHVSDLQADDIIVYRSEQSGQVLVGRVVAQPGDEVEVTGDGEFRVNGAAQPNASGAETMPSESGPSYPLTLGEDEYFVLGDGRTQAVDSRALGPIGINEVEGKVIALLRLRGI